jgi:hypothetical protein
LGRTSSASLAAWLNGQDPALAERLRAEADIRGESVAQFLRIAAADFLAEADEDAWASLVSALRGADDPGAVCAARLTAFRLKLERTP